MTDNKMVLHTPEVECVIAEDIVFAIRDKETLRITPDGFSVQGRKLDVQDTVKHDKEVYQALLQFLREVSGNRSTSENFVKEATPAKTVPGSTSSNHSKFRVQWCWRRNSMAEIAYGPFDTRVEAIEDARSLTEERKVLVGHCKWVEPVDYASRAIQVDHLIEKMEELAGDNGEAGEDEVFEFKISETEATKELESLVDGWAEKHLRSCYWVTCDEEEVELEE